MKWLRQLFWRRRIYSDLSNEIQEHLEEKIEELVAGGMSREEAGHAARREFGNVTLVQEDGRNIWRWPLIENLLGDVRYGLRTLRKSPGFSGVAVLTLALGIGANTAIFSLVDAVLLRALPIDKPEQLLQVLIQNPRRGDAEGGFTNPLWEQLRDHQDVFSDIFAWGKHRFDLAQQGEVQFVPAIWVSGSFFNSLRLRPAAGRLVDERDDHRGCPAVVVLSYAFWQRHYAGADSAIGATLSLNRHPFEVIGVAPPRFFGMEVGEQFAVAAPICSQAVFDGSDRRLNDRSSWWLQIAGRTKPGIELPQAVARLNALSATVFNGALPQNWSAEGQKDFLSRTLTVTPAAKGVSEYSVRSQFTRPLEVLMAFVGLVMLIACANIASLMLARSAARRKEVAVRRALGASRARLITQLLTECLLLSSAGALLGVLFARWGTALLVRFISTSGQAVILDLSPDGRVTAFTAMLAILTGILFGLLPALKSTRVSLTSAMKGSQAVEGEGRARFRTRKWIVAFQVGLSLVVLISAGLLLRSFVNLATLDIGFDRNNVLLVGVDLKTGKVPANQQLATYESIEGKLAALPGVVAVGRSLVTQLEGGGWSQQIKSDWSTGLTEQEKETWMNSVSPGYFDALHMQLVDGRGFTARDTPAEAKVTIINQTLAHRFFANQNPLGKSISLMQISGQFGPPIEIVGVVKDAKYETVREETHPTAFVPDAQYPYPERPAGETFALRLAIPPSSLVLPIQSAITGVNKGIPIEFRSLAQQVNDSMIQDRVLALLSGFFGALALLLATIGLYGTISYLVSQRQTEFGIRMALGAQRGSILRLVMKDVVIVLAGGLAGGAVISLAVVRVLQDLLFRLPARDAVTMGAAICILSVVAFVAGYLPARRATGVDPMVALRYE